MTIERLAEMIDVKEAELEALRLLEKKMSGGNSGKGKQQEKEKAKEEKAAGGTGAGMDYESMKATELYKECCRRKISSQCTSRGKEFLIKLLKANDEGKTLTESKESKVDTNAAAEDDWGDEPDQKNPYEGKKAIELYKMCVERGMDPERKLGADVYAKMLLDDDAKSIKDAAGSDDGFDDDEWNID